MVLCAGLGTRLRPLTDRLPKPLVPIGDRPLLAHILARLAAGGITEAVINAHQMSQEFISIIQGLPLKPQVVLEDRLLGTAGGIANARAALGPAPIVVHTGDILCRPPVAALLAQETEGLCLAVVPRSAHTGPLGLDAQGRVVRLRGRKFGHELRGADYIGVCVIGERCLASLPNQGCLIQDWAIPELEAGREITTVETRAPWTDVGDPVTYHGVNLAWLGARPYFVAPDAVVANTVELRESVVGRGARVQGTGVLEGCVVWPGAEVQAPLERAVVMDSNRMLRLSELAR
jgi:mannose-1-phosphate guanylyltransferase